MTSFERQKRIDLIRELAKNMTVREMVEETGMSDGSIRRYIDKYKIQCQKPEPEQRDRPKNMYKGFELTNTRSGWHVGNGGGCYSSKEVAKKCIDTYLARMGEYPKSSRKGAS